MKRIIWLFEITAIVFACYVFLLLDIKIIALDFDYRLYASSYVEIKYSRDGITSYDGWIEIAGETIYVNIEEISTPNCNSVEVYDTLNDLLPETISDINEYYDDMFQQAIRLSTATARYNCHSYAWYSQSVSNNHYWMSNPESYYSLIDMSYIETEVPRVGDIICYYDDNGTTNESDDVNLHSGIVIDYDPTIVINNNCGNSNQVTVKSKWGAAGLYRHKGDECPYTSNHGGSADYVKYYRPRVNNTYSLSQFTPNKTRSFSPNGQSLNIIDKYEMYELNINYQKNYQIKVLSSYTMDVRLYDSSMQLLYAPSNTINNGGYAVSMNPNLQVGRYYLRVSYMNTSNSGTIITQIISHTHNYNEYQWHNYMQHQKKCSCGLGGDYEPHVVEQSSFQPGQQYATCLLCGGHATIGFVGPLYNNIYPITPNGSYILPNGVIVLVAIDIEAYLDGTLVFNYPNIDLFKNGIDSSILKEKKIFFFNK